MNEASETFTENTHQVKPRKAHNAIDITGKRYGRLLILGRAGTYSWNGSAKESTWNYICDCGMRGVANKGSLRGGYTKSCGCLYAESRRQARASFKCKLPFGEAAKRRILKNYKGSAKHSGRKWLLSNDDFYRIISSCCHYCGQPPSKKMKVAKFSGHFFFNGIDRVDNRLGYEPSNVVPCCSVCNHAKCNMSQSDFLLWISKIADFVISRRLKASCTTAC